MLEDDILVSFHEESKGLLKELGQVVTKLEAKHEQFPSALLEEFAQKIDRIMGAAKTVAMAAPDHEGLTSIGKVAEISKMIGYKAAEKKDAALLPIFAAFWADTIEHIDELLENLGDKKKSSDIAKRFSTILQGRLKWLASHLK